MNNLMLFSIVGLKAFCFFEDPMKDLGFLNKNSILDSLPEIAKNYIVLPGGKLVVSGTILFRPLEYLPIIDDYLHHEGVVIGTTASGEEVILEMNNNNVNDGVNKKTTNNSGIQQVTILGFLNTYGYNYLKVGHEPDSPIEVKILKNRAEKYKYTRYNIAKINCIDFANWLVFGEKRFSFKEMQLKKCDDLIGYFNAIVADTHVPSQKLARQKELEQIKERKEFLKIEIEQLKNN
jgi:hypothetical protein